MRKLYTFLFSFLVLFCCSVHAQYQVNGSAVLSPSPGFPNEFQLVPPNGDHVGGSVFNTTQIDLSHSFELNVQMYFGVNDDKGDGMALVLQNEGPGYIGNSGAGLGYHRFNGTYPDNIPADNPGPVPSFIIEFDTFQNGPIGDQSIGDPAGDHIGFMSHSDAYHTSSDALAPPVEFPSNIEDGQWHDAKFTWNASTHTMTVLFLGNTYSYTGNIVASCLAGNPVTYWGFTGATGDPSNEHRVRIVSMTVTNQPPVVNAGTDQTITQPLSSTTLSGSATDPDGSISTHAWSFVSGPATATVSTAGNYSTGVTGLTATGNYIFKLVATDNNGASTSDSVTVTVNPAVSTLSVTGVVTNNCTTGSINITASGGTTPYQYSWSNGSTSEDLSNVAPNNYTVTVTDHVGATKQATFTVIGDVTPPSLSCSGSVTFCSNILSYYIIPSLSASDNCGIASTTFTITGATSRSGIGNNASGFFNGGTSTITWTVKDNKGNTSHCTTQVTITVISVDIPDVYTVNPGGDANTIYLGYGPSSLTLIANPSGGTTPYTYLWSTGSTGKSITVSPSNPGLYPYLVVVRDANGCIGLMIKLVRVVDIRCGNKNNSKVTVCHNGHELCIDVSAVPAHLAHGDNLGSCDNNNDRTQARGFDDESQTMVGSFKAYPNPSTGKFQVQVSNENPGKVQVMIVNTNGTIVDNRTIQLTSKSQIINFDLSKQAAGVYLVKILTPDRVQTEKVLIQH